MQTKQWRWGLLLLSLPALAQAECFTRVGHAFGIAPALLEAIAWKESKFSLSSVNAANSNHTEDVCMMQVNSVHFGRLKQLGVTRDNLLHDPCTCIATGAWVLHGLFRQYGRSWNTVGMYNTGPSEKRHQLRQRYADDVQRIYKILQKQQPSRREEDLFASNETPGQ
ncbi:lytic transglycosylase domain-containing protein [Cedecea neteri]|uniref:lytic transglycosylase domain-containing protein n=1 Tax=Cedecea neteri TaxID=158822 RepID=UPI002892B09A|nr:lytic transglycosylase domain-containing protein [Cedecea neteri]WNJ78240.1 lytic transglycosylase domain-containing protein [Cedecea neteri]